MKLLLCTKCGVYTLRPYVKVSAMVRGVFGADEQDGEIRVALLDDPGEAIPRGYSSLDYISLFCHKCRGETEIVERDVCPHDYRMFGGVMKCRLCWEEQANHKEAKE